jgi:hypothetical protein
MERLFNRDLGSEAGGNDRADAWDFLQPRAEAGLGGERSPSLMSPRW